MAGRKRQAITGPAGTTWTNTGTTCKWQLIVNWHNSCARCVQYDRQIAPAWGIPFHYGCNCTSVPVWPGQTAEPFVDYRDKIQELDPAEQSRVMGRAVLDLVESGTVTWDQAVTRSRILTLQQVVSKYNLTVDQMIKAGVNPYQAGTAWSAVHTQAHQAAATTAVQMMANLKTAGLTDKQIQNAFVSAQAKQFKGQGASGKWQVGKLAKIPKPKPTPAAPVTPMGVKPKQAALQPAGGPTQSAVKKPAGPTKAAVQAVQAPVQATAPVAKAPRPATAAAPPPPPQVPPKAATAWPDLADLTDVKGLGGSTGARLMADPQGNQYVFKRGGNPGHLESEDQTDRLYRAAGMSVPDSVLKRDGQGPYKLARFLSGQTLSDLELSDPGMYARATEKIKKGFVVDALLGNWDVIGLSADNVLVDANGKVYRIDNGGSLLYRAQGRMKHAGAFGPAITELDSMRNPLVNASAAKVFGSLTDAEILEQARAVLANQTAILAAADQSIRPALAARLNWLEGYVVDAQDQAARQAAAAAARALVPTRVDRSKAKRFNENTKAMADWGQKHFAAQVAKIKPAEGQAIYAYTGSEYKDINHYLRGGTGGTKTTEMTTLCKSGLSRCKTPEAIIAYRGVKQAVMSGIDVTRLQPGDLIQDPAVISTSLKKSTAVTFANEGQDPVVLEIAVPNGSKGAYVNAGNLSVFPNEHEFILPPGTGKFVYLGQRKEHGTIILEVELE